MHACKSYEEKTAAAQAYLSQLPMGTHFILSHRPDNPHDPKAIAAIRASNGEACGYVPTEALDQITPFLDEYGQCDAYLQKTDGHVTYWVSVNIPGEAVPAFKPQVNRVLTPCPLPHKFKFGMLPEEQNMDTFPHRFVKSEISNEALPELHSKAEMLLRSFNSSLCRCDAYWQSEISKKIGQIHRFVQKNFSADEATPCQNPQTWSELSGRSRDLVGDFHRKEGHGNILQKQFNRLLEINDEQQKAEELSDNLQQDLPDLLQQMREWLKENLNMVYSDQINWSKLGHAIAYKRMSRLETYEVLSVLVLLKVFSPTPGPRSGAKAFVPKPPQAIPSEPEAYVTFKARSASMPHLQFLRAKMIEERWLSAKTDEKDFLDLFSGERNKSIIYWGDDQAEGHRSKYGKGTLVRFFRELERLGIIEACEAYTIPNILMHHVADLDGVLLTGLDKGDSANAKAIKEMQEFIKILKLDLSQLVRDDLYDDGYDPYDHQDLNLHNRHGR